MSYREDPDLVFLAICSDEELNDLVECLTKSPTGSLKTSKEYKANFPHHSKYWKIIAEEMQLFGGNSFANLIRGGNGVLYKEILCDVCNNLKVNFNKDSETILIEEYLFQHILTSSFSKMSEDEKKAFFIDFLEENQYGDIKKFTPQFLLGAFQTIFKANGFASYKLSVYVANLIWKQVFGKGLSLAFNSTITKGLSLLSGPVGWSLTAIWTAIDLSGPAYRITIPAVVQIAMLRQKKLYENKRN